MPPSSFLRRKIFIISYYFFISAQANHLLDNPSGVSSPLDNSPFPLPDEFNKNFLIVADTDEIALALPSDEFQNPSKMYNSNAPGLGSSPLQISSTNNNDGCRALGRRTEMLPSYTKKLLKRQGRSCPATFLKVSPGAGTEAGQQLQGTPADSRIAPAGAGFGPREKPSQRKNNPSQKNSASKNRKLAPPEFEPEKKKCGNFEFDTYLVCGPLVGASPSLLDSITVLLAGVNSCKRCFLSALFVPVPFLPRKNRRDFLLFNARLGGGGGGNESQV